MSLAISGTSAFSTTVAAAANPAKVRQDFAALGRARFDGDTADAESATEDVRKDAPSPAPVASPSVSGLAYPTNPDSAPAPEDPTAMDENGGASAISDISGVLRFYTYTPALKGTLLNVRL